MNANDLFPPSQYLKSADITDAGGELKLTVKTVERMEYNEEDGTKKVKGILYFNETESKLALNVGNTHVMIDMFGAANIEKAWVGKPITLYVEMTKFQGKEVPGIRIRKINEKQAAIDAFWLKCNELQLSPQEGREHLALFGGDWVKALAGLEAPTDEDINAKLANGDLPKE